MTTENRIDQPATPAPTWRDSPNDHTTGRSIATKLRLIAQALETLGDNEIATTWPHLSLQVCGHDDSAGRKAAVDAIAAALDLAPATGGGKGEQYGPPMWRGVNVYTAPLHQPGCCEHCTWGV